jgi:hypothetical protein
LLRLLNDALEVADQLKLNMIGCHVDQARAAVVEYIVKGEQSGWATPPLRENPPLPAETVRSV